MVLKGALIALNKAYIWIVENDIPSNQLFDESIREFKLFISQPGAVTQWGEYHLSCLYMEASKRSSGAETSVYLGESRMFLVKSLSDLLQSQTEKATMQDRLMLCRLRDPDFCPSPRGSEPMICKDLMQLTKKDATVMSLISDL
jgi:hypothetical protein